MLWVLCGDNYPLREVYFVLQICHLLLTVHVPSSEELQVVLAVFFHFTFKTRSRGVLGLQPVRGYPMWRELNTIPSSCQWLFILASWDNFALPCQDTWSTLDKSKKRKFTVHGILSLEQKNGFMLISNTALLRIIFVYSLQKCWPSGYFRIAPSVLTLLPSLLFHAFWFSWLFLCLGAFSFFWLCPQMTL